MLVKFIHDYYMRQYCIHCVHFHCYMKTFPLCENTKIYVPPLFIDIWVFTTVSSAATNILKHVFCCRHLCVYITVGYVPKSRIAGSLCASRQVTAKQYAKLVLEILHESCSYSHLTNNTLAILVGVYGIRLCNFNLHFPHE